MLKTRVALAAGLALILSSWVPATLAQVPKSRSAPTAKATAKAKAVPSRSQDSDEDEDEDAGAGSRSAQNGGAPPNGRPDPTKDPEEAHRMLKRMLQMSGRMGGRGGPGGGGGGGGGGLINVLPNAPGLQEELGMTEKQVAALKDVSSGMRDRGRQMFTPFRNQMQQFNQMRRSNGGQLPPAMQEQFQALQQEMGQAMMAMAQEGQTASSKVLTANQRKRLFQLELQIQGPLSVARPDMMEKLRLSPSQQDRIQDIVAKLEQAQRAMRRPMWGGGPGGGPPGGPGGGNGGGPGGGPGPGAMTKNQGGNGGAAGGGGNQANGGNGNQRRGPSPEMMAQFQKMREEGERLEEEAEVKISKVLTSRQKTAYMKMLGEPADPTKLVQGMSNGWGRGGPGGGGNNGRNNGGGGRRNGGS